MLFIFYIFFFVIGFVHVCEVFGISVLVVVGFYIFGGSHVFRFSLLCGIPFLVVVAYSTFGGGRVFHFWWWSRTPFLVVSRLPIFGVVAAY